MRQIDDTFWNSGAPGSSLGRASASSRAAAAARARARALALYTRAVVVSPHETAGGPTRVARRKIRDDHGLEPMRRCPRGPPPAPQIPRKIAGACAPRLEWSDLVVHGSTWCMRRDLVHMYLGLHDVNCVKLGNVVRAEALVYA